MLSTPKYWDIEYAENVIDNWQRMRWIVKRAQPFRQMLIGSVLDLGCGLGYLAGQAPGKYTGVDFSKVAVRYAGQNYSGEFMLADAFEYAAQTGDGSWDTVVLCHILEHLEEDSRSRLLADAKRIASKCVLVGLPMNAPDPSHVKSVWKREDVQRLMGPVQIEQVGSWWVAAWDRDGRRFRLDDVPKAPELRAPKQTKKKVDEVTKPPVKVAKVTSKKT